MAALTQGHSTLREPADCDDADRMIEGLQALGVPVAKAPGAIRVEGYRFLPPEQPLMLGNSGTAMRFLTAACATMHGTVILDGTARMRERPIGDLLASLQKWGVSTSPDTGFPPITVKSTGAFGGPTSVKGNASSQYLTGLLMVAPKATEDVVIDIDGELVSKPYIGLTIDMMAERGVIVENHDFARFTVTAGQPYAAGSYAIEADASGASYFLAAAAVAKGCVRVLNLNSRSKQGDAKFAGVLGQMGCEVREGPDWIEVTSNGTLHGIDVDLNAMPDMAQTLAVTALFAKGETTIRNVANLRIKECDRIDATTTELRKLGAKVEEFEDGWRITPGQYKAADIDTYDDHRMAMSFALAGLRIPGVRIKDPGCVSKTFPDFFERFSKLS